MLLVLTAMYAGILSLAWHYGHFSMSPQLLISL
jgi:hypothetical protein